jgi:hypothetical protein
MAYLKFSGLVPNCGQIHTYSLYLLRVKKKAIFPKIFSKMSLFSHFLFFSPHKVGILGSPTLSRHVSDLFALIFLLVFPLHISRVEKGPKTYGANFSHAPLFHFYSFPH